MSAPPERVDQRTSATGGAPRPAWWTVPAALVWLVVFVAVALSLPLPNNKREDGSPITRGQLLEYGVPQLPDLVDPPPPRADDPPEATIVRQHSGWRYFPQRLELIVAAGIILAGAWGAGHLVLRILRLPLETGSLERTVFAFGAGLAALSLVTLGCGLAGWLSRGLIGGVLGAVILVAVIGEATLRVIRGRGHRSDAQSTIRPAQSTFPAWLWLPVVAPFLLCILLGSLLPSTDFDVNEYHFEGPKEYFQAGKITFLPHNVYTSFPFGTEMLTLLAMVLRQDWYRGALAGKCLLAAFAPLTALALFAAGRRWFGTAPGALAAVFFLTTPWVYRFSTIAYAEGGLTFFLFAALLAVMMAIEVPGHVKRPPLPPLAKGGRDARLRPADGARLFVLAGIFAGSAMACKYTGLVSVVIPLGAAVAWFAWRGISGGRGELASHDLAEPAATPSPGRPMNVEHRTSNIEHRTNVQSEIQNPKSKIASGLRLVAPLLLFGLGTLLAVGPWLLKNTIETGNPVYPLAYSVFGGRDWDADLNAKWKRAHSPPNFDPFNLLDMAVDVAARNDWVNPLLFLFAPLALFASGACRTTRWLWGYVGYLFLSWWLLTHRIDRFWVPMIPVVALLAGAGAAWLWNAAGACGPRSAWHPLAIAARVGMILALAIFIPVNLVVVTSPLGGYNAFLLDLDVASQLVARQTSPEMAYLNERLPAASKVLSVGDAAVFEARFPVVYNTVFDKSIFEEWCADPDSGGAQLRNPEAIRRRLQAEGITHIYVSWREILRYRAPHNYGYTDFVTPERFAELERLGVLDPPWEISNAWMPVDALDAGRREALARWGGRLIRTFRGTDAFVTFQVYPVRSDPPK